MSHLEGHHLQGSANDELAFLHISIARQHITVAAKNIQCPLCKADVQLTEEALIELERISDWAAHNNPDSVRTIRALARELEKLHMLGMLTTLYKFLRRR
jgi:hypothetical protein